MEWNMPRKVAKLNQDSKNSGKQICLSKSIFCNGKPLLDTNSLIENGFSLMILHLSYLNHCAWLEKESEKKLRIKTPHGSGSRSVGKREITCLCDSW